jgi:riboflavin-specific deaminase-like protein
VQRIWPDGADAGERVVDVDAAVAAEDRTPPPGRPWVLLNMIASVDGAATDQKGRSGGLGGPADRELFHALRAAADVIVAGAATVRTEGYGPPRVTPERVAARQARGQAPRPRMAVVSRSLRLDPHARLFAAAPPGEPPIVLTSEIALATQPSAAAARALAPVATVWAAGSERVDWGVALRMLREELGARIVLVEGGPNVNGQLVAHDLVDEICLTVSPTLMCGLADRIVSDVVEMPAIPLRLARVFADDDFLLLRYVLARESTTESVTERAGKRTQ